MVIDTIANACLYTRLGERYAAALNYLSETDFSSMEPGKYEVDGSSIYALVQKYESKHPDTGKWEGHRKYADIQYVVEGLERMGYANIKGMKAVGEYNSEKDYLFFEGEGDFLAAPAGTFMIFAPQDIHMPGVASNMPAWVRKVVVKVML